MDNTEAGPTERRFRDGLATVLAAGSLVVVLVFGSFALYVALSSSDSDKRFNYAKDLLGILLPIAGTWMGTIIAFYFSKANFESAASNTLSLVKTLGADDKLRAIRLRDAMISRSQIDPVLEIDATKNAADFKLKKDLIDDRYVAKQRERLPILDSKGAILYVAHRSLVDRFIVKAVDAGKKLGDLTLADIAADTESGKVLRESFRTLPGDGTLADAKHFMDTVPGLSDVFITKDGTPAGEVIGWITDGVVLEKSRA